MTIHNVHYILNVIKTGAFTKTTLSATAPKPRLRQAALDQKSLRSAWSAEEQAIAIYTIEQWIFGKTGWSTLRKRSLESFTKILHEERSHQNAMRQFISVTRFDALFSTLNRFGGYTLGTFLSVLPSRLSWKLHRLAELQAEAVYRDAIMKISNEEIREKLTQAADQERGHANHFQDLLLKTHDNDERDR